MRTPSFRVLLPLTLALLTAHAGWAQVTVDPRALDPLNPNAAKPAAPAKPAPPAKPTPAPKTATPTGKPPAAINSTVRPMPNGPASPPAGLPAVPTTPPAAIVIPPAVAVPTRPAPPPIPATVDPTAPGVASQIPGGVRISFGSGRADLNPATENTLRTLVRGGPGVPAAAENASYTITSFAAGTPEDPSTARRLSLSRATVVRSVLIAQGIASVRIYVRALGPASMGFADGPPDRADVIVGPPVMPVTPTTAPVKPAASKP